MKTKVSKTRRWICSIAANATLLLAIAVFTVIGVGPRLLGYRTLTVLTGSMSPRYPAGAVVIVSPKPEQDLRVGDVLAYQAPIVGHPLITHRVVSITPAHDGMHVQTKGDANAAQDPWVVRLTDTSAWTVRGAIPGLGTLIRALRGSLQRALLIWIIPLMVLLTWLAQIWRPGSSQHEHR